MSAEDATPNTERATRFRNFTALLNERAPTGRGGLTLVGNDGEDVSLSSDDLLAAANALDALGVTGWAAARLQLAHDGENPVLADVVLETIDTAADRLVELRACLGDARVEAELDEFREQL